MHDNELVILSIVAESPRYGHEVQQVIDQRGLRRWVPIGHASVYHILSKLENDTLVSSEFPFEDLRSARKRYTATPAGYAILKTGIVDALTHGRGGLGQFDLALLTAHLLPPAQVQNALYQRRVELMRQIERHRDAQATVTAETRFFNVQPSLFQRAQRLLQQDLAWLAEFEALWAQHHSLPVQDGRLLPINDPRDDSTQPSLKRLQKFRRPPSDD